MQHAIHAMNPGLRLASLVLLAACLSQPCSAQEGSLRDRLKQRWSQRQQAESAGPVALEAPAARSPGRAEPADQRFTLEHDGLLRSYRVHIPASYQPARPAPLLVALHGGGGNMDYQADDQKYGLISQSERSGWVVVFPNGSSRFQGGTLATWNAGNCCAAARDAQVDDVGFIRQMVAQVRLRLAIDPQRIYATGMSNGAMMAYRLACEASDLFTAIAAVAGTDNTRSCQPSHPVAVLHIHALNDDHVLFQGGAGPAARNPAAETHYASVPQTLAKWSGLNGCSQAPTRVLEQRGAHCERFASCQSGAAVQLCVTQTGGHSWPGGSKARSSEPPSQAISAVEVMADFFSQLR